MNELIKMIFPLLAGFVLGIFFFGGLWWTVKKALHSPRIGLWLSLSMFVRGGLTLLGIYYVGNSNWKLMLTCLAGLLIARLVVTHSTREVRRLT